MTHDHEPPTRLGRRAVLTGAAASPAPARRAPRLAGLAVGVGLLLGLASGVWVGLARAQLASVFLTVDVVTETTAPSSSWAVMIAVTSVAVALLTAPSAWTRHVDAVALVGATWLVGCTAVFAHFGAQFEFTGSQPPCIYASCWPNGWQELAAAAPLGVTALVMVGLGTAGRRLPWLVRAAVPALTFVVLSIVQVAVWDSTVIPVLHGPPPF